MSFLTELDVVNACLGTMGETPLNTLDEDHPMVPAAQTALRVASFREQAKSWWFNKELLTLAPDVGTGNIYTPEDAIRVDPSDTTLHFVQRGRRLYQPYVALTTDKYRFSAPVTCWIVRKLGFEELPPSAQVLISCAAQIDFQTDFDGDDPKYSKLMNEYKDALMTLNAEHIRNQNVNLLNRPSMRQAMRGMTPTNRLYR